MLSKGVAYSAFPYEMTVWERKLHLHSSSNINPVELCSPVLLQQYCHDHHTSGQGGAFS